MSDFVHLHVHTEYSLLDGLSKISPLFDYVKDLGMDSLAITDHGAMYGAIEFYKKAKEKGVKPIIGIEAYITENLKIKEKGSKIYHLTLLAKNEKGYKNLMKLTSIAHLDGYYYKPRIDFVTLSQHHEGLICLSGCGQGEIPILLFEEGIDKAKKVAEKYLDLFKDDYYLELQLRDFKTFIESANNQEIKSQLREMENFKNKVNPLLIKLSRSLGIPIVVTNDSHYTKKEDAAAQDAAVCISTGKHINDTKRLRYIDCPDFYIKSPSEMSEIFKEYPDAVRNTIKISDKCDLEISTLGKWFFPKFDLPDEMSADQYLTKLVNDSIKDRGLTNDKEVRERADYELEIIKKKGYSTYFLIVKDIVDWCNQRGIITNTRGSAAGSLVSFLLGITKVDPIKYYLPFERFLNPYRPSPPDIDLDIADDRREELLAYITEKYGKEKVAQLCTFGRMLSRQSVRDIARVLGYPYSFGDKIAKLIPPPRQGFPVTIPKAINTSEELRKMYDTNPDAKKILDLAIQIEGNARHVSVHAAGVVMAPTKITDFTPVQREPSGEKIITQYEMHAAEDVGLIKFDILGIRNLSILGAAIEMVKKSRGIDINLEKIPLDDKKTFEMLGRGETMGVFQLGSTGMTKYLMELKPERVEDLMAMVALYRPGPISVIPEYIKRKHNKKKVEYLDPRMEKFLGPSYGLIVYQDDLLFCAIELAGYTWEEADKFRKAVGKKIPEEMAAQKEKFINGIVKNGQTKKFAEELWRLFEPFQSYGFNKAHAASYGIVAYQTAYMKANFPVEYMCALLSAESNDKTKIAQAVNECKRMKINVLPPDVNESDVDFSVVDDEKSLEGKAVRFGLNAIKNVGEAAISSILSARRQSKFTSFVDFLKRVDSRKVNKKVLESLIKVGALSSFGKRYTLLSKLDEIRSKIYQTKSNNANQQGLFSNEEDSLLQNTDFMSSDDEELTEKEISAFEKELLGFSLSSKPIYELISSFQSEITHKIFDLRQEFNFEKLVKIAAVISDARIIITKKTGQEMAFIKVADETGEIEAVVFPKIFDMFKFNLVEDVPVLLEGRIDIRDEDTSFIVENIKTLEDIKSQSLLTINIPKKVTAEQLHKLKKFFLSVPGPSDVILVFEGSDKKIKLPIKISWNEEIANKIQKILSNNNDS